MNTISIDEIKPGMILATDLRTRHGRLLLPSGSEITEEHLKIARIWGITEAKITDDQFHEKDSSTEFDPEIQRVLDALASWRFACCDHEQAVVRQLVRLFRKRVARGLTRNKVRELVGKYRGPGNLQERIKLFDQETEKPRCEDIVQKEVGLVSLPEVFHEIVEVVRSPTSSAGHIAEVISRDPSLSSRILRLVNSSFYGFMARVDTLTRAVAIVGTVEITNLAMGIAVTSTFTDIPPEIVDMPDFWEHSLAVGVLARIMAAQTKCPGLERLFVGGLLHDIGRLVLLKNYPRLSGRMILATSVRPATLYQLEKKSMGFSHAGLGGRLLKEWEIPESLADMVGFHHCPEKALDSQEACLIHIADIISHALGLGHSGARRVPPITDKTWKRTGLPVTVLPAVAAQAENQLRDLMRIIVQDQSNAAP
ncbi:HDOD domain-containing protein [Desulfonatronovibrio hydrogenovorans]|uniref:HDOD domain-containing protein n=1 Tax=Desulfonatronovibrio hydrogenovorans TaxID=53245 RepID=UPI00055572F0|nr:HDOD domain-containing protein [Desulfonatronovibrio hydrogenovorans]